MNVLLDLAQQPFALRNRVHFYRCQFYLMAALCWFMHPGIFILASLFVVYTLYQREFNSKAVVA
ncbi:DUF599 family protein, partial [Shewanella sp. SG44-6]|uniref:DUF599 family protein n=1 Tax=Shewanella sp. SG44-6 TaxID=2760959 RepID=UPI003857D33A